MLVFIDESGDQGLRNRFGSSSFFVVAAVIFLDGTSAFACGDEIAKMRKHLLSDVNREFKFNKCARSIRWEFLNRVRDFDFHYVALVIDKVGIAMANAQIPTPFYQFACERLVDIARPYLRKASVTIDGSAERQYRREFQKCLRNTANRKRKVIEKVRMEPSGSNNLLQLADMVCGAVARSLRVEKEDRYLYRGLLVQKELEVFTWPKNKGPSAYPFRERTPYGDSSD